VAAFAVAPPLVAGASAGRGGLCAVCTFVVPSGTLPRRAVVQTAKTATRFGRAVCVCGGD
jgi:hypothetical protein